MVSALVFGAGTLCWVPAGGTSCFGNRDKLRPDEPLGSNADFTIFAF